MQPTETIRQEETMQRILGKKIRLAVFSAAVSALATLFFIPAAFPREPDSRFSDHSGAEFAGDSTGLNVGYVPTPMAVVDEIFALCPVGPRDFLIDLGSGDGRIVTTAARRFGTRGRGVDLNAKLVELSRKYAAAEGVSDRTEFRVEDIFRTDIRAADLVTLYLLPDVNLKLRPRLLKELKPGARVVSHNYHMGDWRPDKIVLLEKITAEGDDAVLYFWVIPADVRGDWQWQVELRGERIDFLLRLRQRYQDIGGEALNRGVPWPVFDANLTGDRIRFSLAGEVDGRIVRQDYEGRIAGAVIQGIVRVGGATEKQTQPWKAIRSPNRSN